IHGQAWPHGDGLGPRVSILKYILILLGSKYFISRILLILLDLLNLTISGWGSILCFSILIPLCVLFLGFENLNVFFPFTNDVSFSKKPSKPSKLKITTFSVYNREAFSFQNFHKHNTSKQTQF
ncbi:hypothetical protein ACJX0J_037560, partial [Zea mays]